MARIHLVFTYLLLVFVERSTEAGQEWHWGYSDNQAPAYWPHYYDDCGKMKQSPIDIALCETTTDTSYTPIHFNAYENANVGNFEMQNNGHTVQVDITNGNHSITSGRLPASYKLAQFHFHFGRDNNKGSEHLINGRQFPLEMHLVHYDPKYNGISEAKDHPDGLAVVGVLFQVAGKTHEGLNNIVQNLNKVALKGNKMSLNSFRLADLLPDDPGMYFRYSGSLTTPPCSESVVWTVLNNPVPISQAQIDKFRELYEDDRGEHRLIDNYRPPQPVFGRSIYSSFETGGGGQTSGNSEEEMHWSYDHKSAPPYWLIQYENCVGHQQSPIDVPLSETKFDESFGKIRFDGYESDKEASFALLNNGHTVQVDITNGSYTISGGKLPATYKLAQFHYHWGADNKKGSEHLINGQQYPLELHLVHYDTKYDGVSDAKDYPNGIAVVAVLFQIGKKTNLALNNIVQNLPKIRNKNQEADIDRFPLSGFLPNNTKKYFRYSGSLTTPPCSESVVWTVFNDPAMMSQSQIDEFRKMFEHELGEETQPLVNNFRPVQPLFERTVYSSFRTEKSDVVALSDAVHVPVTLWCLVLAAGFYSLSLTII